MNRLYSLGLAIFISTQAYSIDIAPAGINYIENKGQWEKQVKYKADLFGGWVFLEQNALTFLFMESDKLLHAHTQDIPKYMEKEGQKLLNPAYTETEEDHTIKGHAYKLHWQNANKNVTLTPIARQSNYHNYYIGNDPKKWQSGVAVYRGIVYNNLYEHIDLKVYAEGNSLKSDYIVRKGGHAADIRLFYDGVEDISIDLEGKLEIKTSVNKIIEYKPYAYQVINGDRREINCSYSLKKNRVSFAFPDGYDPDYDLVIDPTLIFSTYSGSTADNWGSSATNDSEGNMFLGGIALDFGYPTTIGAFQTTFGGGSYPENFFPPLPTDVVITKFTADGSSQLYSTHLGGASNEVLNSLLCTPSNELIAVISTSSSNFPVTENGYDRTFNGGDSTAILDGSITFPYGSDIAVTKLNADGTALVGSTFFGGSENDGLNQGNGLLFNYGDESRSDVAIDNQNNIYLVTNSASTDIPGTGGKAQPSNAGSYDGVIAKFSSNLSTLNWATYYGGSGEDAAYSIQLDNNNNILFCGGTTSSDLPAVRNGLNSNFNGGTTDGFVAKLNAAGTSFTAATYLGTSDYDQAYIMDLDDKFNVYIFGQTLGAYPVTQGVYSNSNATQFIHKLNNNLNTTSFSTVFGSPDYPYVNISPTALLIDKCDHIYAVGWGGNVNFSQPFAGYTFNMPVTEDAFSNFTDGSDFYLISLNKDASSLIYATYFGEYGGRSGDHVDGGTSRFDKNGIVYQAICASCGGTQGFPTTPDVFSRNNLSNNCNMAGVKFQFDLLALQVITAKAIPPDGCSPFTTSFTYTATSPGTSFYWDFGDNTNTGAEYPTHTYSAPGTYRVKFIIRNSQNCNPSDSAEFDLVVSDKTITNIDSTICNGDSVIIGDKVFKAPGEFSVVLFNTYGCDSTVNLLLSVTDPVSTQLNLQICEGDSIIIGQEVFYETGEYTVVLNSSQYCDSTVFLNLTKLPIPEVDAIASETLVDPGTEVQLSVVPESQDISYSWEPAEAVTTPNSPTTNAIVTEETWFYVTATNRQECSAVDSVLVQVRQLEECDEKNVFLPNSFSPNDDGKNDEYLVRSSIPLESMTIMIFNRWGEKVFETSNQDTGWDGNYNGKPAAADTYGFYFEGICNGNSIIRQGNITIIR